MFGAINRFFLRAGLAVLFLQCNGNRDTPLVNNSDKCPTPKQPYLHLELEPCRDLIPPPTIENISIQPPGGKVPLEVTFRAQVAVPYPELRSGLKVEWDLDGNEGADLLLPAEQPAKYTYTQCQTYIIRATPVDILGKRGNTFERQLTARCNQPPIIRSFTAIGPNGPPNGRIGTTSTSRLTPWT